MRNTKRIKTKRVTFGVANAIISLFATQEGKLSLGKAKKGRTT